MDILSWWNNRGDWFKGTSISFIILILITRIQLFNFLIQKPYEFLVNSFCEQGLSGLGCAIGLMIISIIIIPLVYALIIGWIYSRFALKRV